MKAVLTALVLSVGILSANSAMAQYPMYGSAPVVVYRAPAYSSYYVPSQNYAVPVQTYASPVQVYSVPTQVQPNYLAPAYAPDEPGFFERLMDLERRKNAWLRQTFLGMP